MRVGLNSTLASSGLGCSLASLSIPNTIGNAAMTTEKQSQNQLYSSQSSDKYPINCSNLAHLDDLHDDQITLSLACGFFLRLHVPEKHDLAVVFYSLAGRKKSQQCKFDPSYNFKIH